MKKISYKNILFACLNVVIEIIFYYLANFIVTVFNLDYYENIITWVDEVISLRKEWMIIYILSYAYWLVSSFIISTQDKKEKQEYLKCLTISIVIGFIGLVIYPSRIDRIEIGVYDQVSGNDFLSKFCYFIYEHDGGQYYFNLCPSFHCLETTICFLGLKDMKIKKGYKIASLIFALLIYLSTLFTKQHYLIDVVIGIIIPIIVYLIVKKKA